MGEYHYTSTCHYYYDATLTQDLLTKYINTLSSSTATKTNTTYLGNIATMSHFSGEHHTPNPETSTYESEESHPSIVEHNYVNFTEAVNVDFDQARSAASAAGVDVSRIPNGITLMDDGTYATNITFANGGAAYAEGNNTRLTDLTFTSSGGSAVLGWTYGREEQVVVSSMTVGNVVSNAMVYYATTGQKLNGLRAKQDFDELYLQTGASATATDVVISRNMRTLNIANDSGNHNVKNRTGEGTVVDIVTVSGKLDRVHVGSGALLNMLTVGTQRNFASADREAFGYYDSNWGSWTYSSATYMEITSGGTASNIYLGNGGSVFVSGPSDTVTSAWNETKNEWEYTTSYASGTGGTLTNLQMAMSGGLQFDGISDPTATWQNANNVYLGSYGYKSHYSATAPQSAYVEFQSNTVGSNISIGQGGSMRISSGASVTNISMGALVTSTFHNNDGKQMTWVGDRGAKLVIDGGFASNVVVEGANLTSDYYFAVNNGFSTLSSSIQNDYYEKNSSYLDSNVASASAAAQYNAYMSSRYNSVAQNLYDARYLGGEIIVQGGTLLNASRFAYLYANDKPDVTFSSDGVKMTARDGEVVSKAEGALSATVEIDGAAHVTSVTVAGGRIVMGGNSGGVTRWAGQSNAQSNYALIEYLDLRTSGLEGDNHSAMVLFGGHNYSNTQAVPVMSNGSQVYGSWTYYKYDCMDPGEIHYLTGNSGLVVKDLGWGGQNFTYIGSGAVTINGLGTVVLSGYHSRACSDSYYGKGPYLSSAINQYYFGVVKGVYDEKDGKLQSATILNGEGGFDWTGTLVVGSGGIVQDIGTQAGLKTANTLTSDSWNPVIDNDVSKILVVVAGGSADNVAVTGRVTNYEITSSSLYRSNAALLVSSGGTATNVSVLSGGMAMAEGGTINGVFVGSGGILYLSGWAGAHQVAKDEYGNELAGPQYLDTTVLNAVRLDSGGQLAATLDWGFRSGGHAPSVIANKGGGILNGVTANGVAYVSGLDYAGNLTLTKDQQALDVTVRGFTTVTSRDSSGNPTAWTTTIASLNVSSGGIVNGATVGEDGAIYVSDGANVKDLTASGGRLIFGNSSGWSDYFPGSAAVAGITVMDGGILEVNSKFALTATRMQIKESAGLELAIVKDADEDHAVTELNGTWTAAWGGGTFTTTDGVLSGFGGQFGFEYTDPIYGSKYTSARLSMTFLNGATLLDGDLRGYGYFSVRDGAKVLNTKIKGITANIGGGGYASGLSAITDPTNSAYQTNIYVYGNSEKGTVGFAEQTVLSGGYMGVERGGLADGVTMLAPEGYEGPAGDSKKVGPAELEIVAGGTVSNVYASAGVVTITEGSKDPGTGPSTLSNAEIHSSAMLLVNADGVVLDGTLKLAGTVVTTAERYEYVEVEVTDPDTGKTYTDYQRVEKNSAKANAATLTVTFDLTERNGEEESAMIDNLANLDGVKLAAITVSADQSAGAYVLAGKGTEGFQGTLSVTSDGKKVCDLAAGGFYQVSDDLVYKLSNTTNAGLVFSVLTTDAAVTDIVATSNGQELLKGKWSKYAVNIKTEVNQYTKSIWYRIKQAVLNRTRAVEPVEPEWLEFDNETGIEVAEYCTVEFMAKNEKGKESKIVSYTVNYDATAPELADLRIDSGEAFLSEGVASQVSVMVRDELDLAPKVELSFDGEEWTELELDGDSRAAFTVTGGTDSFTLRTTDHADNVNTLVISIPVVEASADIVTVTNQDVTVSAAFSADSTMKQYSLDGGETWLAYDGGVVLRDNATVSFRAANILGYSDTVSLTVDYIDKEPPKAPEAAADITTLTNGDVTVTAEFSEDSVKKEYTLDGGETWEDYTEGGVIIIINGTVGFRGVDEAGNASEVTNVVIDNIDKDAPVITLRGDNETPLQRTTLFAAVDDGSELFFSTDQENWTKYEGEIAVTENGAYYFKATDAAGNTGTAEIAFENIDAVAPVITLAGDNETPLQAGTLTATVDDDSEIFYSTDQETWTKYEGEIEVTGNGTYYFKATDAAGNTGTNSITFGNIDSIPPADPVAAADNTEITDQTVTVTAAFSEDSVLRQYSLDGTTWQDYTDGVVFEKNGTVSFRAADAAGNESGIVTYTVGNIVKNGPDDHKNDSLLDDNGNLNPNLADSPVPIEAGAGTAETGGILLDESVDFTAGDDETYHNFVGASEDTADYAQLSLESAAKLRFSLSSYDQTKKGKVKFSLISYDSETGKKKVLKSATSSKNKSAKTAEVYVDPNDPKTAGLQYYLAVENKGKTDVYYNVELTDDSCVYADGDKGDNDGPLLVKVGKSKLANAVQIEKFRTVEITESGAQKVHFDSNAIAADGAPEVEGGWNNFVGYGDDNDYVKLSATQPVKLNFTIRATGSVKLVVYSISNGSGKWVQETVKTLTVSLTRNEKNGSGYATRFLSVNLDRLAGTDETGYYVSVQSTNAKSGGQAWYNVSVDSIVCPSDSGTNNKLLLNSKPNGSVSQTTLAGEKAPISMEVSKEGEDVEVSRTVNGKTYNSFVGYGDEYDYAELVFNDTGTCTFELETWGTSKASAKLTVYKLTLKKGKWSKKTIGSIKVRNSADAADGYASGSDSKPGIKIDAATSDTVKYYVGVQSIDAKKGKEVYYNVSATFAGASGAALDMPQDDLLAGQTLDALADASLSAVGTTLDPASDKLLGESAAGILASL